jgi:hypothetical protein
MAMLVLGWPVMAHEHPGCRDMTIASEGFSRDELLAIAQTCLVPEVSELFLNRAYHLRMLEKYERFERSLLHYGSRDHRAYIEAYRMHIGLAEAFASNRLQQQDRSVLQRLNRIYDESSEIAEMRFRGYDLIANRLERNHQL